MQVILGVTGIILEILKTLFQIYCPAISITEKLYVIWSLKKLAMCSHIIIATIKVCC